MRIIARYALGALLLLGSPLLCSAQGLSSEKTGSTVESEFDKFFQFYRFLNAAYVDTVNNHQLIETAIQEMLAQLDPHSTYVSAEEMKGVTESFEGSFSGIGIEYNILRDTIIVVNVISGGPSEQVGLLPNDRIIDVNGKNVVGVKQMEVPKLLRGPKGTVAEIRVIRGSAHDSLDFTIVRDNIPITTVDAAYLIAPKTGYIRVNRFANNTFSEFVEAYKSLGKVDALILDLRSNGGGLLGQAIDMSNFFLKKGDKIVSTEGLRFPPEEVIAPEKGEFSKGRLIVLTNETSASGSEIVAGAIQDWDRGLIVGRRTFGKGLVQRQFPLNDGSAVRLTVSRYHTPTGRVIQRPYVQGKGEEYNLDFLKRFDESDSNAPVDSSKVYKTLRSGRTVYGGGGISPDVSVATDTSQYTPYWGNLVRKGVIIDFVISYMDQHRAQLTAAYPTVEAYIKNFRIDQQILDELQAAAAKKEITVEAAELEKSRTILSRQMKALIAQKLWNINEYYMVLNAEGDEVVEKALEIFQNWQTYSKGIISE